jgi:phospholipid/cholesterol/gamma-HCH transport system substrate-binding protein
MAIKREIKVGIFVIVGLIVAGVIIFMIGDERRVFDRHYDLNATFTDVAGIKPGAPVRMGGVDVGVVNTVAFGTNPTDKLLHIGFSVVGAAHDRIRKDSKVTISNKGLLGDKMLEITQGSEGQPLIPDGGTVDSTQPEDLQKYLDKANEILDLAHGTLENLKSLTGGAADPQVQKDLKSSIHSMSLLLGDASANDGFVHRLLTDPKMADHLDQDFIEARRAAASFERVATETRQLLEQAKKGPGLAHTLLYSKDGDKILASFAATADELQKTLEEVRNGKGAMHELVYGDSGGNAAKNVEQITADLRDIVSDVKKGKGTIGAFLVDPSVYDDVKTILGNIDRNQVLRALVRYTIKQDEESASPATNPPPASSK